MFSIIILNVDIKGLVYVLMVHIGGLVYISSRYLIISKVWLYWFGLCFNNLYWRFGLRFISSSRLLMSEVSEIWFAIDVGGFVISLYEDHTLKVWFIRSIIIGYIITWRSHLKGYIISWKFGLVISLHEILVLHRLVISTIDVNNNIWDIEFEM